MKIDLADIIPVVLFLNGIGATLWALYLFDPRLALLGGGATLVVFSVRMEVGHK